MTQTLCGAHIGTLSFLIAIELDYVQMIISAFADGDEVSAVHGPLRLRGTVEVEVGFAAHDRLQSLSSRVENVPSVELVVVLVATYHDDLTVIDDCHSRKLLRHTVLHDQHCPVRGLNWQSLQLDALN